MAHIERRGKFQYRVKLWRPDSDLPSGGRFESRTFEDREAAEEWVAEAQHEIRAGLRDAREEAESTTLAAALDRYEKEITPAKRSANREHGQIRRMRARALSVKALAEVRGKDIADYIRARQDDGVGPNSIRIEIALLSHLFETARTSWGMVTLTNPVPLAKGARPKIPRGRERRLLPGEEERLLAAAQGEVRAVIVWAIETAMRRGEISAMRWEHLDQVARVLLIPDTKNGEPRRVPLSTRALAALDGLPRATEGQVWSLGHKDNITHGFERARAAARARYEQECEADGKKPDEAFLKGLTYHDLRHEATSRLFELGLNPMEVSSITGHKTLQMLKRYTHLKAEDLAKRLG